jgi:hypothetical protein
MADQQVFEGLEVSEVHFELGGGGTARSTDLELHPGDVVSGTFTAKVVSIKHPFKSGTVVRVQTLNIEAAELEDVVERYSPPERVEQPELGETDESEPEE